jgi:tetratricopeptide (TPR) repeat protein
MRDADRVLRPLYEAGPAIERLETYESPAVLLEALRATWHAVDRTLRLLLRNDPAADDELRLSALAEEMALDDVITALRRRDRITLFLAGRVHELGRALQRAESTGVLAADADHALDVVRALETEIGNAVRATGGRPITDAAATATSFAAAEPADEDMFPASARPRRWRPRVVVPAAAGVLVLVAATAIVLARRESDMDRGVAAFGMGSAGVAEQHFRAALTRDRDNVTARLYLGRIMRTQGRYEEAAQNLREAALLAPGDAAVRRELGYLFLALDRPPAAVEQFRMAVELDAEEPLGWVGLIEALHRSGDPSADEWLRRAPASAQAMIRSGRR